MLGVAEGGWSKLLYSVVRKDHAGLERQGTQSHTVFLGLTKHPRAWEHAPECWPTMPRVGQLAQ